jgi:hypothetical protein
VKLFVQSRPSRIGARWFPVLRRSSCSCPLYNEDDDTTAWVHDRWVPYR